MKTSSTEIYKTQPIRSRAEPKLFSKDSQKIHLSSLTKHLRREHATEFDFVSLEFCLKIFLGLNRACGSQVREQGVFPKGWFSSSDEVVVAGDVGVFMT